MNVDPVLAADSDDVEAGVRAIAATRFGRYTLVAKLGQGAMAEVFLALRSGQAGFQKLVVIKRLHPHLLAEKGVREMFLDEARLAALLSHPNVVQTNEVAEVDGCPFMALEYLNGQPVSQVISRCKAAGTPLPAPLVARLVADALDGLQHAHELQDLHGNPLGVVHRDVSPHNLFVSYDGVTKLLDFGVAKASLHAAHTEIGAIKGKYAYLSPEQAEQREVDGRSDVWGMGVVLWECLTGRRLFKRDTEVATIKAVLEGEIPPATQYAIDAPPELSDIAAKALKRDVDERYESAQAMKDDLEHFLGGLSQRTRRRDVGQFLRVLFEKDIEERRAAVSACLRGEVGDDTAALVFAEGTQPSYSNTHDGPPPRSRWMPVLLTLVVLLSMGLTAAVVWPMAQSHFRDAANDDAESRMAAAAAVEPGAVGAPAEADGAEADGAEADGAEADGAEADGAEANGAEAASNEAAPSTGPPGEEEANEANEHEGEETGEETVDGASTESEAAADAESSDADEADGRAAEARRARLAARRRARAARRGSSARNEAPAATGTLYLDTTPWTSVSLGPRSLGDTPLSNVELPAGRHVLTLRNPGRGIEERYTVVIEPGQVTRRRVGLR